MTSLNGRVFKTMPTDTDTSSSHLPADVICTLVGKFAWTGSRGDTIILFKTDLLLASTLWGWIPVESWVPAQATSTQYSLSNSSGLLPLMSRGIE
jgi:hypothetical protein